MEHTLINGFSKDISTQMVVFKDILQKSKYVDDIFTIAHAHLKQDYYVGAGFLVQTVWNYLSGNPLEYGITDVDIVYFDENDLKEESEKQIEKQISARLSHVPFKIDVKNEARVHVWYEKKFGFKIKPYHSVEEAINTWPTTATSIGVRKEIDGSFAIYAPYGLNDIFGMIIRANKTQITKKIFENKAMKWSKLWPKLTVIPWER